MRSKRSLQLAPPPPPSTLSTSPLYSFHHPSSPLPSSSPTSFSILTPSPPTVFHPTPPYPTLSHSSTSTSLPKKRRLQQLQIQNESLKSKLLTQESLIDREVLRVSHEVTEGEPDLAASLQLLSSSKKTVLPPPPLLSLPTTTSSSTTPPPSSSSSSVNDLKINALSEHPPHYVSNLTPLSAIHKTKSLLQTISRPIFVKTVLAVREIVNSKLYRASGLNLEVPSCFFLFFF
ncbi:hypothetical protein HMI54_001753 [Coelomomyces lativittatus]|nr:hypothetical protein HMI54_001753 [Coelomomyces lativittatus]